MASVAEAQVVEKKEDVKTVQKRDITKYLLENLDRRPTDIVHVTHIWGSNFRVNWLKPVHFKDSILSTFKMRKSQFLKAEEVGEEVVIKVLVDSEY